MSLLTKEQILQAQDLQTERVLVHQWGGEVIVKALTGTERDAFEASCLQKKGKDYETNLANLRAKLVARSIVDEQGNRLFSDKDIEALGKKSAAALQKLYDVAQRLSGLSDEDAEELAKNSESDQVDDSISG